MEKELTKKPKEVSPPEPEGGEACVTGAPSGLRYASDEQFRKAQRKTSARHAGLFRRLAKQAPGPRTSTVCLLEQEPVFLTWEQIDAIHRDQIEAWGGLRGLRSENGLESAIAQPQNVYVDGDGDLYEIAAAYAYHLAESQAYFDGNKRTAVQSALDFLEINGVDTNSFAGTGYL